MANMFPVISSPQAADWQPLLQVQADREAEKQRGLIYSSGERVQNRCRQATASRQSASDPSPEQESGGIERALYP